ncbi:MAG: pyrroloquinoline-quinone synthase PqqC [Betaproteobacteria bacterium]|jgi:pyrroloquinoline-quinone synthase|nr:pyrroloquinoline-quinone synthase PqqC [Rhodocyclaceae bacterium]MCA3133074.1 pyrroloquinoline-quinone synthase PqqC [Rhodocyclaceae bacterium]MCA3141847.1 pyrroloquinoline-quinone synthase PqqC [Rhodocyclaceae bacterium]MCA3144755.1 pyrroloquinoline-quinone synthase PqqC [Rhodocyclaceae bacterium]MCE2896665.1 pyrroloquinoline-quinone synthase PqqC [Betaproteobacteria bacterium]
MGAAETLPWSREEFEVHIRAKGGGYHIYHPYHVAMNSGGLTREQIQGWVCNRFYYQTAIPTKDSAIMANMPDRDHRRLWIQRIIDHDGTTGDEGGIEAWLTLADAVGLDREEVTSLRRVLPGVRFAVDAYINFARSRPWQEAVCSSLTELFAPEIHKERLANWPQHYPWINQSGYAYFRKRLSEARRDVEHGLRVTLGYFQTREQQQRALDIVQFKLDVLWSMCDAMAVAYGIGERKVL